MRRPPQVALHTRSSSSRCHPVVSPRSRTLSSPREVDVATVDIVADANNELGNPSAANRRARLSFRNPLAEPRPLGVDRTDAHRPRPRRRRPAPSHRRRPDPSRDHLYRQRGSVRIRCLEDDRRQWRGLGPGHRWLRHPDVKALAMDLSCPNRLYAVTGNGVLRTANSGASWILLDGGGVLDVRRSDEVLLVDPARPERLFLTSVDGVLRSGDRGETWEVVLDVGRGMDLVILDNERVRGPCSPRSRTTTTSLTRGSIDPTTAEIRGGIWSGVRMAGFRHHRTDDDSLASSGSRIYASLKTATDWTLYRTTGVGCSVGGRQESVWERGWHPTGSIGDNPIFKRLWKGIHADPQIPNSSTPVAQTCGSRRTVERASVERSSRTSTIMVSPSTPATGRRSSPPAMAVYR